MIEFAGAAATRRFELEALTLDGLTGPSVRLALRGKLDRGGSYTAEATSAPLPELAAERPWPFEVRVVLPAAALNVSGTRTIASEGSVLRLAFDARTADVTRVGRLLDLKLPIAGAAQIAGERLSPSFAALKSIKAESEPPRLRRSGVRPDPSASAAERPAGDSGPRLALVFFPGGRRRRKGARNARRGLSHVRFNGAGSQMDGAARFRAATRTSGASPASRARCARSAPACGSSAGRLAAPFSATIAGARFEGDLAADGTTTPPRLRASLVARDAPLGALAELVFDVPYVEGSVRRFEAVLDAAGNRVSELARDLEGRIRVEGAQLTYGNYAGAKPVAMRLDAAELTQPRGRTIAGQLRGSLRGKAFAGAFRAGTVEGILREQRTPFGFDGASGAVRASLSGTLAEPAERSGPAITFEVTAPHARELAPWLGFSSQSAAGVALKGTVQLRQRDASLRGASLRFGRTLLTGDAAWQTVGGKTLVKVELYAELLAPAELRALGSGARRAPRCSRSRSCPSRSTSPTPTSICGSSASTACRSRSRTSRFRGACAMARSPPRRSRSAWSATRSVARSRSTRAGMCPPRRSWLAGHDFDVGPLLRRLRARGMSNPASARCGSTQTSASAGWATSSSTRRSSPASSRERSTFAMPIPGQRCALRSRRAKCARMPARR